MGGKTHKSLFISFCSNVEKQVACFCCPVYRTLTSTLILLVFWSLERLLEDHESVVDVVSSWPWDSQNKLILNNRREKYAVFRNPQVCILIMGEDVCFKKVCIIRKTPLYLLNTLNRLSPNINMHLLHTVLHTCLMLLLERICPFIFGDHFINSHDLSVWSDSVSLGEKLDVGHCWWLKGLTREAPWEQSLLLFSCRSRRI